MRTIRFHEYGEPADVLRLEEAEIPKPGAGRIRVRVQACGLNPADWALCRGLFQKDLPRGIGLDVAGTVDAIGEGVTGVGIGDPVLGAADYADYPSAGAADHAVLNHWAPAPQGLDMTQAAALPMAVETAYRYLAWLGVKQGQTLLVSGGGTVIGFAAVQIALLRGARVIATAGETYAGRLRALGAEVTPHGESMVGRVRAISGAAPDLIFDAAPVNMQPALAPPGGVLPDLIRIADGDPGRIITCGDFENASRLGVRIGLGEAGTGPGGEVMRWDVLAEFAQLAAEGRFSVPIARTFALDEWRDALAISQSGHARGKLVLLPGATAESGGS